MESVRIKHNKEALYVVASLLKDLNEQVVYVGGRIVGLLITDPIEDDVRPTFDVDVAFNLGKSDIVAHYSLPEAEKQVNFIKSFLIKETLVITAARIPGKKAPLLLDESSLRCLPPHAVVVYLAISNGCNVQGSKHDQIIRIENDILLVNVSGYPKTEPRKSSEAYSQCVVSLLTEIMSPRGDVSFKNKWVQELWVTHEGHRHDALYGDFDEATTCRAKL